MHDFEMQIRAIRRQQKISIIELSKRTGIAANAISDFENGRRSFSCEKVNKIFEVLKIELRTYGKDSEI